MTTIKNLRLLSDLSEEQKGKMEHAAKHHKQFGGLSFKIKTYSEKAVEIQIVQDKNAAGVYHNQKRLIEIVHETFDRFFPGKNVRVHAIPYLVPEPSQVDPAWIFNRMNATGTKLKDIARDTGIDYTQLSALVNGVRPMSQTVQAMFYFYFKTKRTKG